MNKDEIVYSVVVNKDKLVCINTKNGASLGSYPYLGTIISGPIVTGNNQCTVVFDTVNGKKGKVLKLPNFSTITSFNM